MLRRPPSTPRQQGRHLFHPDGPLLPPCGLYPQNHSDGPSHVSTPAPTSITEGTNLPNTLHLPLANDHAPSSFPASRRRPLNQTLVPASTHPGPSSQTYHPPCAPGKFPIRLLPARPNLAHYLPPATVTPHHGSSTGPVPSVTCGYRYLCSSRLSRTLIGGIRGR